MRNSDPGVSVVSVQSHNADLNSIFTVPITGCNFQYGSNFGVSFDASSSLGRVYQRQVTVLNCVRSPVSFVTKYCPISTTLRNHASIQNLLNLSCSDSFSIRSPYCCNGKNLRWAITIQRNFCLDRTARVRNLIVPSQRVVPFSREGIHTLHTLRLLRKN